MMSELIISESYKRDRLSKTKIISGSKRSKMKIGSILMILTFIHLQVASSTPTQPNFDDSSEDLTTLLPQSQTDVSKVDEVNATKQQVIQSKTLTLRPSLEDVASELSKKHLNLEHENWRIKSGQHPAENATSNVTTEVSTNSGSPVVFEEEQELTKSENVTGHQVDQPFSADPHDDNKTSDHINRYSIADHVSTTVSPLPPKEQTNAKKRRPSSNRRKKQMGSGDNENNELYQCHQYLQRHSLTHSTAFNADRLSTSPTLMDSLSRIVSNSQLLPCSCETRGHFATSTDLDTSALQQSSEDVWLNCDHVQLTGSYLHLSKAKQNESNDQINDEQRDHSSKSSSLITRFSQRNSGLQALHSQKFYHLQLAHLRSIDLSGNRIRQVKLDAFHGLEWKLEYLNLANNLLGDSRAIFQGPQRNYRNQRSNDDADSMILLSEELNRLKGLKWLSLNDNQISQLGPNVFVNEAEPQSSQLVYLDLGDNLLKSFPSEALINLDKLQTLRLNGNRLIQLDHTSQFPRSLRHIDLSGNLIKTIHHCSMIDLPELSEINLSYNQLSQLDKTAFLSASSIMISSQEVSGVGEEAKVKARSSFHNGQSYLLGDKLRMVLVQTPETSADEKTEPDQSPNLISDGGQRRSRRSAETGESDESIEKDANGDSGSTEVFSERMSETLDDLDVSESLLNQQLSNEAANMAQYQLPIVQFNSTSKLNLSYNLFESLPGDSLLKFPNLQQLDISYNRIRRLDSNYLCSIYSLVENLRSFDLSGNLLLIERPNSDNSTFLIEGDESRGLNKILGCLLKLEKLHLATNLLSAIRTQKSDTDIPVATPEIEDTSRTDDYTDDQMLGSESSNDLNPRLIIRFGDSLSNRHLRTLDLSDNGLTSMPLITQAASSVIANQSDEQARLDQWVKTRIYLESLSIDHNSIVRLEEQDFEHLFSLRYFSMNHNRLASLPAQIFRRFISLDRLSLKGNKITRLDPFNELFERSSRTLRHLNLANNQISEWPQINKQILAEKLAVYHTANLYHFEEDLFVFDSQDQAQSRAPKASFSFALEELDLEGNRLTSENVTALFDQLIYMKHLKTLNLSYNLLQRIKSEWFKYANRSLKTLILTGNNINNIDLGSFASNQVDELATLHLNFNLIKELKRRTFDSMSKISRLDLGNNMIHTINAEAFHQLNSLKILKLNNNKLTSWKCEYFSNFCNSISGSINVDIITLLGSYQHKTSPVMSSLTELDLSHNSLNQLRGNSISVHTKLIKLNLSHNKLSFIPHDLFKATATGSASGRQVQLISSLQYLNLANNRIQTIDNINFRPLKNLISLDLSFNELQSVGYDVISNGLDSTDARRQYDDGRVVVNNSTSSASNDELLYDQWDKTRRTEKFIPQASSSNWPSLSKLRHINLANNQLIMINQSLLVELSPFALLHLNLSVNYLESETLPKGFYTKISGASQTLKSFFPAQSGSIFDKEHDATDGRQQNQAESSYDLVFTLKLESLDLSHNRLNEYPTDLLENHYSSMESCSLAHNRIQALAANSNSMIQIKSLNLELNPLNRESNELLLFEQKSARYLNLAATRLYAIQQASSGDGLYGYLRNFTRNNELELIRSLSKPIEAPYLRHLNLSSNQLVWLAANVFDKMHSLQSLDLSNNQLTRLHLLNNQLAHVSLTLDSLNLANNLFTSLDSNDFSQLSRLKRLDLSNLLSLRKLNCRFLSRLKSLHSLKMFNYPQVRLALVSMIRTLQAAGKNPQQPTLSLRMQRRMQVEMIMSTIGKHCLQEDPAISKQSETEASNNEKMLAKPYWLNLEELELELFNDFAQYSASGAFTLRDELEQFIGPKLKRLSLVGLNLTSLSDVSLFGVTNDQFSLKVSYTSLYHLPLSQITKGVAKKTRLDLDFRNNNIQSIDTGTLQLMHELQSSNQFSQQRITLRLASNPIKCDCQTRPLWLWLNQRWHNDGLDYNNTEISSDVSSYLSGTQANSNHWLKFRSITYTSDLSCHFPQKLRGKLAHHVNYNDLVCRSEPPPTITSLGKRKKNGTRTSDSYYMTSAGVIETKRDEFDSEQDDDEPAPAPSDTGAFDLVRVTKFNRFPSSVTNTSWHYLSSLAVAASSSKDEGDESTDLSGNAQPASPDSGTQSRVKKQRRDHSASPQNNGQPLYNENITFAHQEVINTNFNKYRPNTLQKHSHFNTLNAFSQIALASKKASGKLLTEFDLLILTVTSVAMIIMSFIIISICLFKYRMDRSDKEQILDVTHSAHNKLAVAQALTLLHHTKEKSLAHSIDLETQANQSSSTSSETKSSAKTTDAKIDRLAVSQEIDGEQVLIPVAATHHQVLAAPPTVANNFLMRSPTIRRMHGLAANASDWFRFTLRAYPQPSASSARSRRKRLFMSNNGPSSGSQLTTAQMIAPSSDHKISNKKLASLLPAHLASGCPVHTFAGVNQLLGTPAAQRRELASQCSHCSRLLMAIKHSNYLHQEPEHSSSETSSSSSSNHDTVVSTGKRRVSAEDSNRYRVRSPGSSIVQRGGRLRTFGAPRAAKSLLGSSKNTASEAGEHASTSQIPSIDVDGRFTYQSDSHVESPVCNGRRNASPTDVSRGENTCSSLAGDHFQDGIFVLMRESPVGSMRRRSSEQPPGTCGSNSVVNDADECSRTSSPVAYGFMRPSPSITTLSSSQRNNVRDHRTRHESEKGKTGETSRLQQNDSSPCTSSGRDEQIIISRL